MGSLTSDITKKYVFKSEREFKKKYTGIYSEHTETPSNRKLTVFVTEDVFDKLPDLSEYVKRKCIENSTLTRINQFDCKSVIDPDDNLQYYVDFSSQTYNIRDYKTDKILYAICEITEISYRAYKPNIYGYYDGLPVKGNSVNWTSSVYHVSEDLYYMPETENE